MEISIIKQRFHIIAHYSFFPPCIPIFLPYSIPFFPLLALLFSFVRFPLGRKQIYMYIPILCNSHLGS